jgi:hypothetical protein
MTQTQSTKTATAPAIYSLTIAPACVLRGRSAIAQAGDAIARFGKRPLIVGGSNSLAAAQPYLQPILEQQQLQSASNSIRQGLQRKKPRNPPRSRPNPSSRLHHRCRRRQSLRLRKTRRPSVQNPDRHHTHISSHLCRLDSPF